jgi:hypothetical protein
MVIIIQLRYGVSSSSIYTTKILHLTSPCIAANLINLIRPTSWINAIRCYIKLTSITHNTQWSPTGFSRLDIGWRVDIVIQTKLRNRWNWRPAAANVMKILSHARNWKSRNVNTYILVTWIVKQYCRFKSSWGNVY